MAIRAYLMGVAGTGSYKDPYRAQYYSQLGMSYSTTLFGQGSNNRCIAIADLDILEHTALMLHLEIRVMDPALNMGLLDIGGFNSGAEALGFPVNTWTAINLPYTTVCRRIAGMCYVAQSMEGQGANITEITFSQTIGNYTGSTKTAFYNAITAAGFVTNGITDSTTLRDALENLGTQNDGNPVPGGGGSI